MPCKLLHIVSCRCMRAALFLVVWLHLWWWGLSHECCFVCWCSHYLSFCSCSETLCSLNERKRMKETLLQRSQAGRTGHEMDELFALFQPKTEEGKKAWMTLSVNVLLHPFGVIVLRLQSVQMLASWRLAHTTSWEFGVLIHLVHYLLALWASLSLTFSLPLSPSFFLVFLLVVHHALIFAFVSYLLCETVANLRKSHVGIF